jgi:hypothetical protein
MLKLRVLSVGSKCYGMELESEKVWMMLEVLLFACVFVVDEEQEKKESPGSETRPLL